MKEDQRRRRRIAASEDIQTLPLAASIAVVKLAIQPGARGLASGLPGGDDRLFKIWAPRPQIVSGVEIGG